MPISLPGGDNIPGNNISFVVNGVDLSAYLEQNYSVSENFGRQGTTARFSLSDEYDPTTGLPHFFVPALSAVVLTDTTLNEVLFAGIATKPSMRSSSPLSAQWSLDCREWMNYADMKIVVGDFIGFTADAIIKSLVAQANIGLTTNNVQPGPTINRKLVNYLSLSAAITEITKLASQSTDYGWFIDANKDVHFESLQQASSPVVEFTDDVTANPTISRGYYGVGATYEWDGQSLRNSCIVRGTNFTGHHTDRFVGNGNQQAWPLTYPSDTLKTSGLEIFVNGSRKTIVIGTTVDQAASTDFLVTQNGNGQWFLITGTAPPPNNGDVLRLNYKFVAPVIARVDNVASQAAHPGSNGGVFQMYVADTSLRTLASAQARGQAELQQFQWEQERAVFTTNEGWPGHVRAGDTITYTTGRFPDSQNGYTIGFSDTFLIISNSFQGTPGGYRTYNITATRI